jgi:hypothetical protein
MSDRRINEDTREALLLAEAGTGEVRWSELHRAWVRIVRVEAGAVVVAHPVTGEEHPDWVHPLQLATPFRYFRTGLGMNCEDAQDVEAGLLGYIEQARKDPEHVARVKAEIARLGGLRATEGLL